MKHLTFDVGTNFDKNLINVIAENNKNNQFSSVFGKGSIQKCIIKVAEKLNKRLENLVEV